MHLNVKRESGIAIVEITGSMSGKSGTDALGETVRELVDQGLRLFVLDLSRVPSMDSASIGEVAVAVKHIVVNGGSVKAVVSRRVDQAIGPVRTWLLFETCPDVKSAIAALTSDSGDPAAAES